MLFPTRWSFNRRIAPENFVAAELALDNEQKNWNITYWLFSMLSMLQSFLSQGAHLARPLCRWKEEHARVVRMAFAFGSLTRESRIFMDCFDGKARRYFFNSAEPVFQSALTFIRRFFTDWKGGNASKFGPSAEQGDSLCAFTFDCEKQIWKYSLAA